ncbi:MAG: hypothetical protein NTW95_01865, partial [Candidatus Aminicenantes bacterium]|nr:hypothetical protein [Candidatus Aminicenantes bacterium]
MKGLGVLSYLKSATLVFLISLCLVYPCYAEERDVTLQWDKSIDDPYLQSYKVYYYTTAGNTESLDNADYAASYTLLAGVPISVPKPGAKPITIEKSNTQITLHFIDSSKDYYFVVTAVDTRGLESIPTPEIICMTLMVSKAGTGAGTVTSSPLGISCGSTTCSANYTGVTAVTLTAAPEAGNIFTGWSGDWCSGTGLCGLTMNTTKSATATFTPFRRLDVVKAGAGTGTLTGTP